MLWHDESMEELRKLGVGLAIVFGSHVTGKEHPGSDVDVGVVFENRKQKEQDPVETYGTLREVFSKQFPGREVDAVYLQEAPLSLQFRAISEGEELFAVAPEFAANYREYVMKRYFDFLPVEREFAKALLGTA